jgi:hypothetical protein
VQPSGVTANVVWYTVKRCEGQAGINNLAPHDHTTFAALAPACATVQEVNWNRFGFCLATLLFKQLSATSGANKNFRMQ